MVPVVIFHLGLGGYGIWAIVMGAAGYMRFGSAGLKSAFQKYVAEATGNGDFRTASTLLSTGSILMLLLSVIGLIPLAIYSRALARISGVPTELLNPAARSIALLAVIMAVANFGSVFEAVVMGAHRIDLTRKFTMLTTAGEAIAIIILLKSGYGLVAMAGTVAISEVIYVLCCFYVSRRVMPEICIRPKYFNVKVFPELIRFAGSYQLVNFMEVLYAMLLPVIVLKHFGAEIAGVYSIVTRIVVAALMGLDALILPLLSGGTVLFASGSDDRINRFLKKSFKVTLAITLLPLAFVAAFGPLLVQAWTGQTGPEFRTAICLCCLAGLFGSVSRVQLILYRASGKALHDNIRQGFRLGVLLLLAELGSLTGFYGVLAGLAVAEIMGVFYMFFALRSAHYSFRASNLIIDTVRLSGAALVMIFIGILATAVPTPWNLPEHVTAMIKTMVVSLAYLMAAWPAVWLTRSISSEERRIMLGLVFPGKEKLL